MIIASLNAPRARAECRSLTYSCDTTTLQQPNPHLQPQPPQSDTINLTPNPAHLTHNPQHIPFNPHPAIPITH
ncbi:hypothetical protein BP00DRAFT_182427 [Aspergillus indologenus CBS 114.80]|uniref:Uncharacterized protein n=1 Tax=Aspergillus indologenus CBS 114.80 TaxID=1450541 RepID=A0A2V5I2Z5_9EURO|nr:hypothetical protein BP00DRAFT_182427 [Aspergillus indologenus CBS 114.80]